MVQKAQKGQKMTRREAKNLFRNIEESNADPEDKLMAIQEVLDMETHSSITKQEILSALRWVVEEYL